MCSNADPHFKTCLSAHFKLFLMLILYLVRHAKSSWSHPGLRDHDRPLNDRGLRDAPRMAKLLVEQHSEKPDMLVSSTAKRALSTAHFFAEAFGIGAEAIQREPDIYEAYPQEILRIVSELPESAKTVMLFGHNPTFTALANQFAGDDFVENVPTCGVVKIVSTAPDWKSFYEGNSSLTACFFPKEVL